MNKISTSVKVTELGDTAHRLTELFKGATTLQNDTFLSKAFAEIEKQANALTTAVKSSQVFSKLEDADAQRDRAIRVLDKLLKGYENIPVENLQANAQKLIGVFKKYGVKITGENYSSQSNLIMAMLEDFSAPELKAAAESLIGVKEALVEIKTKQDAFASIRAEYETGVASQKEKSSATSLRKPLLEIINKKVVPYLVAMNIAQPEMFNTFVRNASEIVISTNEAVKARAKKDKKDKK